MPHYQKRGKVPKKRHIEFRNEDGELYKEELFSTVGFDSVYSLLYHVNMPTQIKQVEEGVNVAPEIAVDNNERHRSFSGFNVPPEKDYLESRKPILVNDDVQISLAAPQSSTDDYFYKNAEADELLFIHRGSGTLRTMYGNIDFQYGDYLNIPRGTIYKIEFDNEDNRLFIVESFCSSLVYPERYRNEFGQLLEHAPYYERDIRPPADLETHDEEGDFLIKLKRGGEVFTFHYNYHPFDLIGWDGYCYPYAFSIHDFEPIVGRVHMPPPVHQTFEADEFVVCSFCPRLYDFDDKAIPVPYNHSNIDCDEVMYYVAGQFMSKKHVDEGQVSLHPKGIPHGPHKGVMEQGIGQTETEELAVMLDTFNPLQITKTAMELELPDYHKSWNE